MKHKENIYNLGDDIYYLEKRHIKKGMVVGVVWRFEGEEEKTAIPYYLISHYPFSYSERIGENNLYKNLDDLLEHLKKSVIK
jgi:hypothetical protein